MNRLALPLLGLLAIVPARLGAESLHPQIEQLRQTVAERVSMLADKLELSDEQRQSLKKTVESYTEKYKALRSERRALREEEMKALGSVLTDEQRAKAKAFLEDAVEETKEKGLHFRESGDSVTERIEMAASKLGLTDDQRTKIRKAYAPFAEKFQALRKSRRELAETEFREVAAELTPEQRQKARDAIQERAMVSVCSQTLGERLELAADKLDLSDDQRAKIRETVAASAPEFEAVRAERRALLQQELKTVSENLTPEQREKTRDYFQDKIVVGELDRDALRSPEAQQMLKETVSERLEAAADKLGLSDEQRKKIRESAKSFVEKFKAQREHREELRRAELQSIGDILTPEQREKARAFIAERDGA